MQADINGRNKVMFVPGCDSMKQFVENDIEMQKQGLQENLWSPVRNPNDSMLDSNAKPNHGFQSPTNLKEISKGLRGSGLGQLARTEDMNT